MLQLKRRRQLNLQIGNISFYGMVISQAVGNNVVSPKLHNLYKNWIVGSIWPINRMNYLGLYRWARISNVAFVNIAL